MIFVDTSAWVADALRHDRNHPHARAWLAQNRSTLVCNDYVVDEVLTLLRARGENLRAMEFGREIFAGAICHLEWTKPADVQKAWRTFQSFQDKQWSFTDCVSKVVIERLEITTAFAFDDHFRQFGNITVVPSSK